MFLRLIGGDFKRQFDPTEEFMNVEFLLATVGVTALLGNSTCMTQSDMSGIRRFSPKGNLIKIAVMS